MIGMTNARNVKNLGVSALALAVSMGALGGANTSALAGDFNGTAPSLKGSYAERVAHVPAPAPLPVYGAEWYVGLGMSFAFNSTGTIRNVGDSDVAIRGMSETDNLMGGLLFAGRYLGGGWRVEAELGLRPEKTVNTGGGSYTGEVQTSGPDVTVLIAPGTPSTSVTNPDGSVTVIPGVAAVTQTVATTDFHTAEVTTNERSRYQFQTGLVSLYYDFANNSRFTPYIGGGVGLAVYSMTRSSTESAECVATTNVYTDPRNGSSVTTPVTDPNGDPTCRFPGPTLADTRDATTVTSYGYVLSGTIGTAFDLTESTKLDVGYRALYTSGTVQAGLQSALGGSSVIRIEDRLDHELRLGMRWDIK